MALSEETSFRLIGGGGTRGLSGDADRVLRPDPALDFFNACLRRHETERDLVSDPALLWSCHSPEGRDAGLRSHLQAASRERVSGLSDLLVIVNSRDWQRAARGQGVGWGRQVVEALRERLDAWVEATGAPRRSARRVGVRLLADGGGPMNGQALGLDEGEFVTGLLPNQYEGPVEGSRSVLAVHLNLPGVWAGYREVARLYDDQDLLTLGNHWLDNYAHPALREPALYRLQYDKAEGLVHLVSPDTDGRYRLQRHAGDEGPSVYAIQTQAGEVVAWLVLAVTELALPTRPSQQGLDAGTLGVSLPLDESPPLGDALAARPTIDPLGPGLRSHAPETAAPTVAGQDLVTLRELGVLIQRVHFREFMRGYEVYLGRAGEVGTVRRSPPATVQVIEDRVRLIAHELGVRVGGVPIPPGAGAVLGADARLEAAGNEWQWRDLRAVKVRGWPYLGELRRRAGSTHLVHGAVHAIGRAPDARVRLPDDGHNENILWRAELDAGTVIRARNGEIPKSRFTLDSIMVATHHAELDLQAEPRLRSVARHCYSFVRRDGPDGEQILPLSRTDRPTGELEVELKPGDDLLVGNCAFEVDWKPGALRGDDPTGVPLAPPPPVVLDAAEDLSEDLSQQIVAALPPPPPPLDDPTGLPGLRAPPPLPRPAPEPDSVLDLPLTPAQRAQLDDPTAPPQGPPPPISRTWDDLPGDSLTGDSLLGEGPLADAIAAPDGDDPTELPERPPLPRRS